MIKNETIKKNLSTKSIQNKRQESTEVKTNNQKQEIIRLFHEQKCSLFNYLNNIFVQ